MLSRQDDQLPAVCWVGCLDAEGPADAATVSAAAGSQTGTALLVEHARGRFTTPGLRGYRPSASTPGSAAWSTLFCVVGIEDAADRLVIEAADPVAELALLTELESLPGGGIRARHVLTNSGSSEYQLDGLEVSFPLPEAHTELLDFTGRHEAERSPQRRPLADGLWVRQSRRGKPGHDSPSQVLVGTPGFGFTHGSVLAVHVAWSGNTTLRVERDATTGAVISGGELLLPGEVILAPGESYQMPWVHVVASRDGLDAVAAALHAWQRSLPAHPKVQPVTVNVWEAVYFDHDLAKLTELARLSARVGAERFVLDDGWFNARRHDRAGLGDWWVDEQIWPDGLGPLARTVHELGMDFGLWLEPEMVNPDSELYRAHPDWVLSAGGRVPQLQRNQLVLDLTNKEVWDYLLCRIDGLLTETPVDFVKWDHNRDLLEAGSPTRAGLPAVHRQVEAFYGLLDELRRRHPGIAWESCAAGGGRIDLGVAERVQRVWTSDVTDALARQRIQRWTAQLLAPEYLGSHVSSPVSHQTGRSFSLAFRAATALFGAFGIEWDLTEATSEELQELEAWVSLHKRYRSLLHSGRTIRPEPTDPAVIAHGVVSGDGRDALLAHVQLDESIHNRGARILLPQLDPRLEYRLVWEGEPDLRAVSGSCALDPEGPTRGGPRVRLGAWAGRSLDPAATSADRHSASVDGHLSASYL